MDMTLLPNEFNSVGTYFECVLEFLDHYQWLYNWHVTAVFTSGVLNKIPLDWMPVLRNLTNHDLNQLPRGLTKEGWPDSLNEFLRGCARFRLPVADAKLPPLDSKDFILDASSPGSSAAGSPGAAGAAGTSKQHSLGALCHALRKGLSPKKLHEVTRLAAVVDKKCRAAEVSCVVDMGCGHGYLCEVLHFAYGYRVVGLESVASRVERATRRHAEICESLRVADSGGVTYLTCQVTAELPNPIAGVLKGIRDPSGQPLPLCIVGLHSCGDLTPAAMKLFADLDEIKAMVLVSCCYHLMERHIPEDCINTSFSESCRGAESQGAQCSDCTQSQKSNHALDKRKKMAVLTEWCRGGRQSNRCPCSTTEVQSDLDGVHQEHRVSALRETAKYLFWHGTRHTPEHFANFPLSSELRHCLTEGCKAAKGESAPCYYLRRPFLRLASQETVERWEEQTAKSHWLHATSLMTRAVFQLYANINRLPYEKQTRRCYPRAHDTAEVILPTMVERMFSGTISDDDLPHHKEEVLKLYYSLEILAPLMEGVTALQFALQMVCEGLVLVDRLTSFDRGYAQCEVVRVADQLFTPRCFALVCVK